MPSKGGSIIYSDLIFMTFAMYLASMRTWNDSSDIENPPHLPSSKELHDMPERFLHYHQSKYRCYRDQALFVGVLAVENDALSSGSSKRGSDIEGKRGTSENETRLALCHIVILGTRLYIFCVAVDLWSSTGHRDVSHGAINGVSDMA